MHARITIIILEYKELMKAALFCCCKKIISFVIHFVDVPTFNNRSANPLPYFNNYKQWNYLYYNIPFRITIHQNLIFIQNIVIRKITIFPNESFFTEKDCNEAVNCLHKINYWNQKLFSRCLIFYFIVMSNNIFIFFYIELTMLTCSRYQFARLILLFQ